MGDRTVNQAARAIGMSHPGLTKILDGRSEDVQTETLKRISEAFGVPLAPLVAAAELRRRRSYRIEGVNHLVVVSALDELTPSQLDDVITRAQQRSAEVRRDR
jgi:transcriptional regulator with XRE-family HTH domain